MQTLKLIIGTFLLSLTTIGYGELNERIPYEVESLVRTHHSTGKLQIQHPSNPRLSHLSECPDLSISNLSGNWTGAVRLQINCPGWQIYWPIQVSVFKEVVQLSSDVGTNHVIRSQDLELVEHDISKLRQGYFLSTNDVIGHQAQRRLSAGMILNQRLVQAPNMVERADKVVIIANRPGLAVSMTGEALTAGALGEQIKVRNLSSGRTITATVIEQKVVQVTLAP